jgi:antitoxin component YwqK of YwqJK toxin-antitoxin module
MKAIVYAGLTILLISCNNKKDVQKKRVGDKIIETNFVEDSLFDGPTKYYNVDGQLESLIYYSKGKKNGFGINFYNNGKVHDSSTYLNGVKNGWHFVYDSTGELSFKDYFFYDLKVGEEIFYKHGKPSEFNFSNFERKRIFSCGYDSLGIAGTSGNILNVSTYGVYINNIRQQGIFVYLIQPPDIRVNYSLGLINERTNEKNELLKLKNTTFFKDTALTIPKEGWKYYVAAHYNDTANKFEKIFLNIIEN